MDGHIPGSATTTTVGMAGRARRNCPCASLSFTSIRLDEGLAPSKLPDIPGTQARRPSWPRPTAKEEASQARLTTLAENLGYLKAKLETAEGAEAAARQMIKEKEAQVLEIEERLRETQILVADAERALKNREGHR